MGRFRERMHAERRVNAWEYFLRTWELQVRSEYLTATYGILFAMSFLETFHTCQHVLRDVGRCWLPTEKNPNEVQNDQGDETRCNTTRTSPGIDGNSCLLSLAQLFPAAMLLLLTITSARSINWCAQEGRTWDKYSFVVALIQTPPLWYPSWEYASRGWVGLLQTCIDTHEDVRI